MIITCSIIYFKLVSDKVRKFIIKIFLLLSFCAILAGIIIPARIYYSIPAPTKEQMLSAPASTYILDRNGELLYELHGDVKRTSLPLAQIPEYLQKATIAAEDKRFYRHWGFEPISILRAALINFRYGEIRQGASTITQQLARTILLNNEVSYERKIKEIILAIKIEKQFSKTEILEMYLNNIPYGSNAYGVAAASEIYFNKKTADLSLLEAAYLAALPKAPSDYSPFGVNADLLHKRARAVIAVMLAEGHIKQAEAEQALGAGELAFSHVPTPIRAPHFVFYAIDYLEQIYGKEKLRTGGLAVYTSLDLNLQKQAEAIIQELSAENEKKFKATNAALVALDPRNGEILAMVGGRDYFNPHDGAFNAATGLRQPGSSFKPYVYAAALAKGLTPASIIVDARTDFAYANYGVSYVPRNYSGRHYGPLPARQALAGSLNVPAVKTLLIAGIDNVIDTAEKFGISSLGERNRFGPSLALGGAEVSLLEHTAGLGAFGNGGIKMPANPIIKILDRQKKPIYARANDGGAQAVDPQIAYLINSMLSDSAARQFVFGRGKNLEIPGRAVAVKTGTTQNFRDAWTIGYTPDLAAGVWIGNNDNAPMKNGADGSVVAAPIWKKFMETALADSLPQPFKRPEGIVELTIDSATGKLPTANTLSKKKEVFASFNNPAGNFDILTVKRTVMPAASSSDALPQILSINY